MADLSEVNIDLNGSRWHSMRQIVRRRLLTEMFVACRPDLQKSVTNDAEDLQAAVLAAQGFMILVLDQRATRILNAAIRTYDITKDGVALIEGLNKKRQPFPELEVMYFVDPNPESIALIAEDFKDQKKPMYGPVHIFLTRHVDDGPLRDLLKPITETPGLTARIRTLSDVNVDFLAIEDNVFHLDMDLATVQLYNEIGMGKDECKERIVDGLVTMCATMNEYPFIRYHAGNSLTTDIANQLQAKLNMLVGSDENWWWHGDGKGGHGDDALRATLFVVGRRDDPVAPFMHEFTYQAMAYDLLEIEKNDIVDLPKLTGKGRIEEPSRKKGEGKYILGEADELWVELRHMHIAEVAQRLGDHIKRHSDSKVQQYFSGDRELSMEDMVEVTREIPNYQAIMVRNNLHLQLASRCLQEYKRQKLEQCADLEQLLATGVDSQGKEVPGAILTTQLLELVNDPSVSVNNTLRLLALYIITQRGIKEADRRRFIEAANPPLPFEAQTALTNLVQLGVSVEHRPTRSQTRHFRQGDLQEAVKRLAKNCDYTKSRYMPVVQSTVDAFCTNSLPLDSYPYVIEPPPQALRPVGQARFGNASRMLSVRTKGISTAGAAAGWSRSPGGDPATAGNPRAATTQRKFEGSRVIVFVAGGATYSELRGLHEVMKDHSREIIVGTTHIIRPEDMINGLQQLDRTSVVKFLEELKLKEVEEKENIRKQREARQRAVDGEREKLRLAQENEVEKRESGGIFSIFGCCSTPEVVDSST